jgi:Protein of unknown function (DUF3800)
MPVSESGSAPPYYYIAYIDEAGDPGIERVRPIDDPGASEWLVIGAVLIEASNEAKPVEWVRSILDAMGAKRRPALHFRDLHEWQKPLACQGLAKLPVNLFVMASNKKNMRGYRNERAAAKGNPLISKQVFYNFCLRLMLERVTDCCFRHSMRTYGAPRHVKIFYSKRGGHNYAHTHVYNEVLKNQARSRTTWLKRREIKWEVVDRRLQEEVAHTMNAGVQLADVVASSFFQACDLLPPTIFNPDNARLLRDRIAVESGYFRDYGVVFQPYPEMTKAQLDPRQKDIFEFYGYDRRDFDVPWLK